MTSLTGLLGNGVHGSAYTVYLLLQLASAEMEKKLRKKKHIPLDMEVEWQWFSPVYSSRVRMLEWKGDRDVGLLGQGSTARVK